MYWEDYKGGRVWKANCLNFVGYFREREQRLSALTAAQSAKEEEIQKKIQQKVRFLYFTYMFQMFSKKN